MLKRWFEQIVETISADDPGDAGAEDRPRAIRKATAVLMVDVALADRVFDQSELTRVLGLVERRFGLEPDDSAELIAMAETQARDLVSLHDFTQLLHDNLDNDEKAAVVGMLWEVAYADGELDKYEDALILKISDLLHVNRARVMRLKHDAMTAGSTPPDRS